MPSAPASCLPLIFLAVHKPCEYGVAFREVSYKAEQKKRRIIKIKCVMVMVLFECGRETNLDTINTCKYQNFPLPIHVMKFMQFTVRCIHNKMCAC